MSVIMEFAMFPTHKDSGVSEFVSRILAMIRETGYEYQLTPMGTLVETPTLSESLMIIEKANELLLPDCHRVYCTAKFDIREGDKKRMKQKIYSVENRIGDVNT